jgi:leucyl-tRNA---protein transferase
MLEAPPSVSSIQWYSTATYPCSYLPQRESRSKVAILAAHHTQSCYDTLIQRGFRRSGTFVYAPNCKNCAQCLAVRLDVQTFSPTRSQRRAEAALADMNITRQPLHFDESHFQLYHRYQTARHKDAGVEQSLAESKNTYQQFLLRSHVNSELLILRHKDNRLLAVSVIDWVSDGLSAVYTFYEPDAPGSLGTGAVMWMVAATKRAHLRHVYLGYWIADSPKMAYKSRFTPSQRYQDGEWCATSTYV